MSNVVCFAGHKEEKIIPEPVTEAAAFIGNFYEWAQAQGIDTETQEFKWEAATIMTIVQGMIQKRNNS